MSENHDTTQPTGAGIFSAADLKHRVAACEAAKAAEEERKMQVQEEKRKAVIEEFHKPPERTTDQLMQLVMGLVSHAAEDGHSEVQVYRFPNALCSDGGRRINNSEPDWETTLEGRPKFAYEFWHDQLRPLGFHLKAEVLDYPGGMPGDIGFFLSWK
jgi:hypothetical protein